MRKGYLSQYFDAIAVKRLSAVEADVFCSNQHEFNGVEGLKQIFGEPAGKDRRDATFMYFDDGIDSPLVESGFLTWYDARQKARLERGVMRSEYRLYFPTNQVSQRASPGDLLLIAKRADDAVLTIIAENGSTIESQLLWLFDLQGEEFHGFAVKSDLDGERARVGIAARIVLDQIGVEVEDETPDCLEQMLHKFGGEFPKTVDFSKYARETLRGLTAHDDPDAALIAWMEREEILFRALEQHLLGGKLRALVAAGVEDAESYVSVVQSALQRRKSRAGSALENHLEQVFHDRGVTYTRTGVTEGRLKPDFIFPSIECYREATFPAARLTMLASKTTCKDRWRQILNEAERIPYKHLVTLEPGISENQTNEMRLECVQLVLPRGLHATCTASQQAWLMDVAGFTALAKQRQ